MADILTTEQASLNTGSIEPYLRALSVLGRTAFERTRWQRTPARNQIGFMTLPLVLAAQGDSPSYVVLDAMYGRKPEDTRPWRELVSDATVSPLLVVARTLYLPGKGGDVSKSVGYAMQDRTVTWLAPGETRTFTSQPELDADIAAEAASIQGILTSLGQ